MDISTGNWFEYLREEVLTEGLRDIGLPEFVVDYLEDAMDNTSEKAKMYVANNWKESRGAMSGAYTPNNLKYEVVRFFIDDMFKNYVITNNSAEPGTTLYTRDPVARVVPPYDINIPREQREEYDDERLKLNEVVAFVIVNIRNALDKPQGTWRKAFMKAVKALSKAGLPSEKVESFKEYLRSFAGKNFHYWMNQYSELVDFLNDDPTNYELVKGEDISRALTIAHEYLENKEDPEFIMHEFGDGSYWYNLDVSSCDVEASRMGHCGSDSRGVLVSLRKRQGKRRESSSYVTMTWSDYENTLYQIKGRSNQAPPEETWDHIAWFINNYGIESVEETGEHSNDLEGFEEMNEYLASKTNASFHGSIEERIEKAEEYCNGVVDRFYDNRDELEQADISYSVEEMDNEVYVYASAEYNFNINLGWSGIEETDTGYIAANPQDFEEIPRFYSGAREFMHNIGLDDMVYDMPGEDTDYEYEVEMLVGAQPEHEEFDTDAKPTAHLVITLRTNETFSADEDGEVSEFDDFADNMLAFEEDEADAYRERVRQALAAEGYMAKTAYDRSKEELMKITNLDKWHVKEDRGGLEFDWTADDGQPLHDYTGEPVLDSNRAQMYGTGTGNVMGVNPDAVSREIFGFGQRYRFANFTGINDVGLAIQFSKHLSGAVTKYLKSKCSASGQLEFDFCKKYKAQEPTMILADDTDFVVFPVVKYGSDASTRNRYPNIQIKWLYRMRVGPDSPPEESEVIQEIASFLNENEGLVIDAANKTIAMYVGDFMKKIQRRKDKVMNNQEVQKLINRGKEIYGGVLDQYGDVEGYGTTAEMARKVYTILQWFESNYEDMGEAQRYIMVTKFLAPIVNGNFRSYSDMGEIDRNTGAPVMFNELVPQQIEKMGGQPVKMKTYNDGGEGHNRNESVEDQISRIENLIAEQEHLVREADDSYDLRIYSIKMGCVIDRDIGGSESETATEIRGIEAVTTVRPIAASKRPVTATSEYVMYDIKFELLGSSSRVEYRDEVLLPRMRTIKGLKIMTVSSIHRTNRKGTIRTVRENSQASESDLEQLITEWGGFMGDVTNFGGAVDSLATMRNNNAHPRPTPAPTLQAVLGDWAEGGVKLYDMPSQVKNMAYHSMVPVEEFFNYEPALVSREFRAPKDAFDGMYQNFIRNGPQAPVYVALGQNGRIKVTGGEDILWFAKRAGLREVPVFYSYQRQV